MSHKFTSKRAMDNLNPPKLIGSDKAVISPLPYSNYELLDTFQPLESSILQNLLHRWRTLSTSGLFDTWEVILVDFLLITTLILIVWFFYPYIFGSKDVLAPSIP